MNRIFLALIIILVCDLLYSFTKHSAAADDTSDIGDIRYSILKPEVFKARNHGWELLDGRAMEQNWDLYKLYRDSNLLRDPMYAAIKDNLPDARGVFLRGMNENRDDGNEDKFAAENNRPRIAGEFQPNAFKKHNHNMHYRMNAHWDFRDNSEYALSVPPRDALLVQGVPTDYDGSEKNGEAKETRPGNISVYIYIKVKN